MTAVAAPRPSGLAAPVFAITAFFSAALVFMVEPMMARLVLPVLGGSAAVWNTSLAFFQAALLVGYVYAHLLQPDRETSACRSCCTWRCWPWRAPPLPRCTLQTCSARRRRPRTRRRSGWWACSPPASPSAAPFAALSATAPLRPGPGAPAPCATKTRAPSAYGLYAASNLGSLIALIAYPTLVEPNVRLHAQALAWTAGYAAFAQLLAAALGAVVWLEQRRPASVPRSAAHRWPTPAAGGVWRERLVWLGLQHGDPPPA